MTRYLDFSTGNDLLDQSLENYLMHGIEPGGFLTAVLSNNLWLAASRADHWNQNRLASIVKTIFNNMPEGSLGNPDLVRDWIKDLNGRRSGYAYAKEREYTFKVLKGEVREKQLQDPPF